MGRSKLINIIISGFFVLLLGVTSFFGVLLPKNVNSDIEKRRLADWPERPLNFDQTLAWPAAFDLYYQDHFGFRYTYLNIYRHLKFMLKDSPIDWAVLGRQEGWIFLNNKRDGDTLGDYRNRNQYTPERLETTVQNMLKRSRWLKRQGIEFIFMLAPSKAYIYPEKLPKYIRRLPRDNVTEQLLRALAAYPEIHVVNLYPPLKQAARQTGLYFKADTHWNFYGANIAQYQLAKTLAGIFPGKIEPHLYLSEAFNQRQDYFGDLANFLGLKEYFKEQVNQPIFPECSKIIGANRVKRLNLTFTTSCQSGGLNALIFRDSFFTSMQPFTSAYFNKATYVANRFRRKLARSYIKKSQPDVIVEEWVDRRLPR